MQKFLHLEWSDVRDELKKAAEWIADEKFDCVVGVARGGLVPAVIISHKADIPLYTVGVRSYTGMTPKLELTITQPLDIDSIMGSKVLLVDDISDTGRTIDWLYEEYSGQASGIQSLTVCTKATPTKVGYHYSCMEVDPSEWVVFPWENVSFSTK